jgi:GNAT superfamily N-acetyltransferase
MADVFVRAARLIDAAGFASVQHRSWQRASQDLGLPPPPELAVVERGWERAVTAPPSVRHTTWVAVETGSGEEVVVGAAAVAPASDPDLDASTTIELLLLTVDPDHRRRGHGSRLLTATMQTAMDAGEREAVAWVPSVDDELRTFLEGAGWAADGAYRTLAGTSDPDADEIELRQVRLATALVPAA